MYLGWYGFERMIVEGLRTDSLLIGNIRVSQLLAGLLFVACVIVWLVIHSKIKAAHDDNYLKCYAYTEQFEKDEADYAALQALKADKEKWKRKRPAAGPRRRRRKPVNRKNSRPTKNLPRKRRRRRLP